MMPRSRRQFLQDSLLTSAALSLAGMPAIRAYAAEEKASKSPNERLNVAIIGARGRGGAHIAGFSNRDDVRITYVCDVDKTVGPKAAEAISKRQPDTKCKFEEDVRKVLEDKSVDIVGVATPNHWHALMAIWAIQAGKDVYVEKPVSHNVSEGRRIVEAARKYKRICQAGTQSRSNPGMREAIQYIHDGKIGEVKVARGLCYKRRDSIGPAGTYEVPASINYDLWCGPAPMKSPTRNGKFGPVHYDWHWIWDYGNGDLGNQGIHQMDIGRWGLGEKLLSKAVLSYGGRFGYVDAGETPNTQIVLHDYGPKTLVFEVRGLPTPQYKGAGVGVIFEGSEGALVSPSYNGGVVYDKAGKEVTKFAKGDDRFHFDNFLKAVRSRDYTTLNGEIEEGHISSALCHTGNISYRLGEQIAWSEAGKRIADVKSHDNVKDTFERMQEHLKANKVDLDSGKVQFGPLLSFDPKSETFPNNEAANKMLTRDYRPPFVVPAAGEV
jgi:predicted dehydrogenase